jgi:HAD superfamily hydrolase (TIGR01509 family)
LAGVRGLLRRLKARGYKLAVASNRPTSFSYLLLRHLKLRKYFNYVLCADRLKRGKPHPEIIRRILERFSLQPGEALLVGDMVVDILAGRRAGVKTALVCGGSSPLEEAKSHKPDFILRKVSSLLRMINSLS